jgi:hypothetical protein
MTIFDFRLKSVFQSQWKSENRKSQQFFVSLTVVSADRERQSDPVRYASGKGCAPLGWGTCVEFTNHSASHPDQQFLLPTAAVLPMHIRGGRAAACGNRRTYVLWHE